MWGHAIQFARWQHPAVRLGARFDVPVTTLVSQIVCGRAEFLEAQHCMSSYDLLREARECDSRTEYNWERSQSRRSCQYVIKLVNLSILRRAARYAQHSLQWGHYVSSCLSVPLSFPCQHPARWPYASHAAVGQHSVRTGEFICVPTWTRRRASPFPCKNGIVCTLQGGQVHYTGAAAGHQMMTGVIVLYL